MTTEDGNGTREADHHSNSVQGQDFTPALISGWSREISMALQDTPQITNLVLHFKSDRRRLVRSGKYACMAVQRSSRHAGMADRYLDSAGIPLFSEWEVSVFPVPRTYRHSIQQCIINTALPQINGWLHERAEAHQSGEQSLTFFFDEQREEFTSEIEEQLQPWQR
jgi:hypothetical protein